MANQQMPMYGGAPEVPGVELLAGQIIQLSETIESLRTEMHAMNLEINRLNRRGRDDGDRDHSQADRDKKDDDLVDRKFFTPEAFGNSGVFREWKTEFEDFIAGRDKALAKKLEAAEKEKEVITSLGDSEIAIERAEKLFRVIRKLVVQTEAKSIVTHVPDKNPWEVWRLLAAQFDPQNDAYNTRSARDIISVKAWKVKAMHELPAKIAEWEHLRTEHP